MHNRMPPGRNSSDRRGYSTPRDMSVLQKIVDVVRANVVIFFFGIFLLCVAAGLLFWNEGRAVQWSRSLDEATSVVHSISSPDIVDVENSGLLVHFSGPLNTPQAQHDDVYSILATVVKLKRIVETYQWVETEHKRQVQELERIRTDISYSYSTEWRTELIDSDSFDIRPGHYNPKLRLVEPLELTAERVQVGNFYLSRNLIDKVNNYKPLILTHLPPVSTKNLTYLSLVDGVFYHSLNPSQPQIGDTRVTFEYAGYSGKEPSAEFGQPDVVSVIGRQEVQNFIGSFKTLSGDEIELLYFGEHTAQAMFARERASNALLTWALRLLGWLLMFVGFGCVSNIVTIFFDWIPLLRDAVHLGVNSLNAVLAISGSLVFIAFGWLWYRPLLGTLILLVATLPCFLFARNGRFVGTVGTRRTDYRE